MIAFFAGLIIGVACSFTVMALCIVASDADYREERYHENKDRYC